MMESPSAFQNSANIGYQPCFDDIDDFELLEGAEEDDPLQPYCIGAAVVEELEVVRKLGPFSFVDTWGFQLAVGVVILFNLAAIIYEATHPEMCSSCFLLDQVILIIYCIELLFRLAHFGCWGFFCHPSEWVWNWVDISIVVVGASENWIVPLLVGYQRRGTFYEGAARCARLLRAFKLLRVLSQASFAWTAAPWFQWFVAAVITLNAIVMGIETDSPSPVWWWVNQIMLLFFVFELGVRITRDGCRNFFLDPEDHVWNLTDFWIVIFGVADLWGASLYELFTDQSSNSGFGRMMMLLRMLRLMRILRLLKLVKSVRPLYTLALGVTQAMQSIFWVLVLTTVTLYAFAILATRMIGHALLVENPDEIPKNTRELFGTIPDSMFTLFSVMNGDNWHEIEPLFYKVPMSKPAYVIFTISSTWALLSVMTGVVSEHMLAVRESQAQKDEEAQEQFRVWLQKWLRGVFAQADRDGSDTLARDEYLELLRSPFHVRKLEQVTQMPVQDLAVMYDWLDADGNGELSFKEFLHGFDWLNEPISGKSILKLSHAHHKHCNGLWNILGTLRREAARLSDQQRDIHTEVMKLLQDALIARRNLNAATSRLREATREMDSLQSELSARAAAAAAIDEGGYF